MQEEAKRMVLVDFKYEKFLCSQNTVNQPKSTAELGCICPRVNFDLILCQKRAAQEELHKLISSIKRMACKFR